MKSLERMIDTMKDDLMDAEKLFHKAKEAKADNQPKECEKYINKSLERLDMWDKDMNDIHEMVKRWESEELKRFTENEKIGIEGMKKIYMKFLNYDMEKGKELKRCISDYKAY